MVRTPRAIRMLTGVKACRSRSALSCHPITLARSGITRSSRLRFSRRTLQPVHQTEGAHTVGARVAEDHAARRTSRCLTIHPAGDLALARFASVGPCFGHLVMPHVKLSINEARWCFAPVAANGYDIQQFRRTGDNCNIHRLRSVCGYKAMTAFVRIVTKRCNLPF
jgi:hypothetical protein